MGIASPGPTKERIRSWLISLAGLLLVGASFGWTDWVRVGKFPPPEPPPPDLNATTPFDSEWWYLGDFAPPEPLQASWIGGTAGFLLLLCTVGLLFVSWRRAKRGAGVSLPPLCACLFVWGVYETHRGMGALLVDGRWPVNLIDVGRWFLVAGALVGLFGVVKHATRPGRGPSVTLLVALTLGCGSTAMIASRAYERARPTTAWLEEQLPACGGIELPAARRSEFINTFYAEDRLDIALTGDGSIFSGRQVLRKPGESFDAFAEWIALTARAMEPDPETPTLPGEELVIACDRSCAWGDLRRALQLSTGERAKIWKVCYVLTWNGTPLLTRLPQYYEKKISVMYNSLRPPPLKAKLVVTSEGGFLLDGAACSDQSELLERLVAFGQHLKPGSDVDSWGFVEIVPEAEARWGRVVLALEACMLAGLKNRNIEHRLAVD